jgi:hypothetical protein
MTKHLIFYCITLGLLASPLQPSFARPELKSHVVSCAVLDDADKRIYRLHKSHGDNAPTWVLSLNSSKTKSRWIPISLYDAAPVITDNQVLLSYQTANGGKLVDLRVNQKSVYLDVYISYELEVNVEVDLSPDVDLLNTEGPLTNLECNVSLE